MFLTSWERFTRAGVAWPACPPGRGGGGCPASDKPMGQHAPARISPATRGVRIRIQIVGRWAEFRWPCPAGSSSSPSKLESRAYVSQSACAPRYPNSTGWPIGRVRPSNASPSPIEPRTDRAEIRSSREPVEPILIINSNKIQKSEFTPVGLAARLGDTGQFTNSWLKMNTAPPEFGEAVSPCLAAPYLFNGTSSSGPHECRLSANDDGCRCRRIVRVFPPLAQ